MSQVQKSRPELEAYTQMMQAIARCDRRIIWIGPPPTHAGEAAAQDEFGELQTEAPLGQPTD